MTLQFWQVCSKASGMEMRCTVAPCQGVADWTLAWMVQQMFAVFFKFKLAQNIVLEAQGAERARQWTPALLTPHDHYVHMFGCDCINHHKYKTGFTACAICICLTVCADDPREHEKREQNVRFSRLLVIIFSRSTVCLFSWKQSFSLLVLHLVEQEI